ncbi:hypothetical protein LINPERPRIM_LOCUS4766 [Linum perenne]
MNNGKASSGVFKGFRRFETTARPRNDGSTIAGAAIGECGGSPAADDSSEKKRDRDLIFLEVG